MKRITHLRRVGITAPDPSALGHFYEQTWGLRNVGEQDGAIYLRGTSPEHHIVAIYPDERPRVRSVSLALPDHDAVDEAARELSKRRNITLVAPPAPIDEPGGGYGFRITDAEGRQIELSADVAQHGLAGYQTAIKPTKISHVVLNSARLEDNLELIKDVLGFTLADWTDHMVFLRCNEDHHSIAFAKAPHASLNHVAFEVPTIDDVLRGIEHMHAQGYDVLWGPGRHGPGHNVFAYFLAPNGQVIEYTSDLQRIDQEEEHQPRYWARSDYRITDPWADPNSLFPSSHAREAMLGEPEN
jgi:catechol-2,3-dioxygenase